MRAAPYTPDVPRPRPRPEFRARPARLPRAARACTVEPGSIVVAPLGPRQLLGVVWEPERMPSDAEVGDNRLRNLMGVLPVPAAGRAAAAADRMDRGLLSRRRPPSVVRMALPSTSALEGARTVDRISRDRATCPTG